MSPSNDKAKKTTGNIPIAFSSSRPSKPSTAGEAGGLYAHPTAAEVARLDYEDLTRRQFSRRKAEYLVDAARRYTSADELEALPGRTATSVAKELLALRGVGPWSASYLMMRSCEFADCVPVGDSGLTTALTRFFGLDARPGPQQTLELMQPFAPFRSLATFHLWMSLVS